MSSANAIASGLLVLFIGVAGVAALRDWLQVPGLESWPYYAVLILAAASTLASLGRVRPLQNVLWSGALVALTGVAVEIAGVGKLVRVDQLCSTPLVWIVVIFNCRGVARLVIPRTSALPAYGFWILGVTILLALLLFVALSRFGLLPLPFLSEGFAGLSARGDALEALLVSAVASFVVLLVVTPMLIDKRPVEMPTDWHPLIVWVVLNIWCAGIAARQRVWQGAILLTAEVVLVSLLAAHPLRVGRARSAGQCL